MKKMRTGFTLVEMLVVIGIIAVVIGSSVGGYTAFVRHAQRARGAELVANVRTALLAVLQQDDAWPRKLLSAASQGADQGLTAEACEPLAKRGVISLSYDKTTGKLIGFDQCGLVSPWATAVIRRRLARGGVDDSTPVPEGGTIADHRLRFAIDIDYDGLTDVVYKDIYGKDVSARVRDSACVWCAGMDGRFGTKDDIYSWNKTQEVK